MNRRLASASVAAVALAGVATAVVPQHATSIVRLVAAAVAAVAGALVLAAVAPYVAAPVPETALDRRTRRQVATLDPHGLRDARRDLGRVPRAGVLPPEVSDRLRRVAELRLARIGIDLDAALEAGTVGRASLPPAVREVLAGRAAATPPTADPARTAAAVHRVLDELDTISHTPGGAHGHR